MKRYITFCLLLSILASCKKQDAFVASNTAEYTEVPNWLDKAMLADMPGGGFDTIYGYTQNNLTYLRYHGVPYRVRAQRGLNGYVVSDTGRKFYVTVFDSKDKPIMDCFVNPGQYLRDDRVVPQPQAFRPVKAGMFDNDRTSDYFSR
jgi:hypothetical protein